MARGRMLNQTIAEDAEFNNLSLEAQLVYLRTIPHLDRDGLINGHPSVLWGKIAPLMPDLLGAMPSIIEEMVANGLVIKYTQGKTQILFFKGFARNQSLTHYDREGQSIFAPPPGYQRTAKGLKPISENGSESDNDSGHTPDEKKSDEKKDRSKSNNSHDQLRTNSGPTPDQLHAKGIEVKENVKETTTTTAPDPAELNKKSGSSSGGLPEMRNRRGDEEFARLCLKFETEGFGTLTQILAEEINALLNEFPVDWISDAMTVAVSANKRQARYVRGILVKWRADGRDDRKPQNGQPPPPKLLSLREWCLKKYHTDRPKFASVSSGIPEATINEQYKQYVTQQQAH